MVALAELATVPVTLAPLILVNPAPLPKKSPPKNLVAVTPPVAVRLLTERAPLTENGSTLVFAVKRTLPLIVVVPLRVVLNSDPFLLKLIVPLTVLLLMVELLIFVL